MSAGVYEQGAFVFVSMEIPMRRSQWEVRVMQGNERGEVAEKSLEPGARLRLTP